MPDLDERLATSRADLLAEITAPPLDGLRRRAARRRHRRTAVAAAVAVLAVAGAGVLAYRPGPAAGPPTADTAPGPVPERSYAADGITIDGLPAEGALDVPGQVDAVQFGDPQRGYLLTSCSDAHRCRPALYATEDGGRTWQFRRDLAEPTATLTAYPGDRVVVETAYATLLSADGGRHWRTVPAPGDRPAQPALRPGQQLGLVGRDPGCGDPVQVHSPDAGALGPLAGQPPLSVCWTAAAPAADGSWWVAGHRNGQAAVAVSRDAGRNWRTTTFGGGSRATVAGLGRHVYIAVTGTDGSLRAIHHSADGGRSFAPTRRPDGPLGSLAGELVPLLDGRLLAAGRDNRWYVSSDDGASFTRAEGTLPAVGELRRTRTGYLATGLFNAGWVAYSPDGAHWRKLPVS